jgi:hypothetical protein
MIKLVDLLLEKAIKIPQDQLSKVGPAFSYIEKNMTALKKKSPKSYTEDPYVPKGFKDLFQLKDLRGNMVFVSLGLYDEPEDQAYARADQGNRAVMVNLDKVRDKYDMETNVEHELVHMIDPKAFDPELDAKLGSPAPTPPGEDATAEEIEQYEQDFIKHIGSPAEFDAHTATLVNTISMGLSKKDKPAETMRAVKRQLTKMLSDIRTEDRGTVYERYKNTAVPFLFMRGPWIKDRLSVAQDNFYDELVKIKAWSTDDALYRRFVKRLAMEM